MNYIVFSSDLANYPAKECIKGINDASSRAEISMREEIKEGAEMLLTTDISHCWAARGEKNKIAHFISFIVSAN